MQGIKLQSAANLSTAVWLIEHQKDHHSHPSARPEHAGKDDRIKFCWMPTIREWFHAILRKRVCLPWTKRGILATDACNPFQGQSSEVGSHQPLLQFAWHSQVSTYSWNWASQCCLSAYAQRCPRSAHLHPFHHPHSTHLAYYIIILLAAYY